MAKASSPEVVIPASDAPEDNPSPEARNKVSKSAKNRQRDNKPARPGKKYRVSYGDHTMELQARDEAEARAKANDARGSWPAPHQVEVQEVSA